VENSKFPLIFKDTIEFPYELTHFSLLYLVERTLTLIKASTSNDFDSTLEVIHKYLKDDDDNLVMLETPPVVNTKNVIERDRDEKKSKKERTKTFVMKS
jgi:hypothetical protein